jgi:hypothetical protein
MSTMRGSSAFPFGPPSQSDPRGCGLAFPAARSSGRWLLPEATAIPAAECMQGEIE